MTAGAERAGAIRRIVRLREVDSTQPVAFALAQDGAPDGTVVVADFQREGRGRRGRVWDAPAGSSLLASIVVRSRMPVSVLPLYSFVAALAVADAVERVAPVEVRLRWPNDALVRGRKIAGILLESRFRSGGHGHGAAPDEAVVVMGIGLNIGQRQFVGELAERATSLAIETGRVVDRDVALDAALDALAAWRARFEAEGFAPVRARWIERSATIGRRVCVDGTQGIAVDLAIDGSLVLADAGGERRISAGEVVEVGRAELARSAELGEGRGPGRSSC